MVRSNSRARVTCGESDCTMAGKTGLLTQCCHRGNGLRATFWRAEHLVSEQHGQGGQRLYRTEAGLGFGYGLFHTEEIIQ